MNGASGFVGLVDAAPTVCRGAAVGPWRRLAWLVAAASCCTGCIGTLHSRFSAPLPGGGHFGWPFYAAVVSDCRWVSGHERSLTHDSGFIGGVPLVVYVAFLGVPVDAALDTVLLPVDVVASLVGWRRSGP